MPYMPIQATALFSNPKFPELGLIEVLYEKVYDDLNLPVDKIKLKKVELVNLNEKYGDITGDGWLDNNTGVMYTAHSAMYNGMKICIFIKDKPSSNFLIGIQDTAINAIDNAIKALHAFNCYAIEGIRHNQHEDVLELLCKASELFKSKN